MDFGKTDTFFIYNRIEFIKIAFFLEKKDLFRKYSFERMLSYRNFELFRENNHKIAEFKHQIDISFKIFSCIWMSDLHCNFFSLEFRWIDLTDWARSYGYRVEILEHFVDLFAIDSFDSLFGLSIWMLRRILSKDLKRLCHLFAYDVSSVTQILKSLNPNDSSFSDSFQEHIDPPSSSRIE